MSYKEQKKNNKFLVELELIKAYKVECKSKVQVAKELVCSKYTVHAQVHKMYPVLEN